MMLQRWLVAIVGLPLLLTILLLCPPWAAMLLVCAVSGIAAYELLHVMGEAVGRAVYICTIAGAVLQVFVLYLYERGAELAVELPISGAVTRLMFVPWLLTVLLFFLAVTAYGKPGAVRFRTVSGGIVGCVVFPMMFGCILLLRMHGSFGALYVLMPFFIAFAGDTLAMYCGRWFGRRKLTPVSPNKTWAGFFGSVAGSVLGVALLGVIGARQFGYEPSWTRLALVAVLGNLFGQLGDLSTSLIKREAGVKDYSRLFLTHGGVLDRFDSTLFIAPLVYFCVSAGLI